MGDDYLLFFVLIAVYLTDCIFYINTNCIAFVCRIGNRWFIKTISPIFRTTKGGIILLNPFPPLGNISCCNLLPFSISPAGVCLLNCQKYAINDMPDSNPEVYFFRDIKTISVDGHHILINENRFCKFPDKIIANNINAFLNKVLSAKNKSRAFLINEFWDKSFDIENAKTRFDSFKSQIKFLKFNCNMYFIYLFIISPIIILFFKLHEFLIPIGIGIIFICIIINFEFYNIHKALYPHAKDERITNIVKMILCPPASVRACDLITEKAVWNYNPIIIANLLLSIKRFNDFIERTLRNLKFFPPAYIANRKIQGIVNWQNKTIIKKSIKCFKHLPKFEESLFLAPKCSDSETRSYCPRCLSQYIHQTGVCQDCPEVKLLPIIPQNHTITFDSHG